MSYIHYKNRLRSLSELWQSWILNHLYIKCEYVIFIGSNTISNNTQITVWNNCNGNIANPNKYAWWRQSIRSALLSSNVNLRQPCQMSWLLTYGMAEAMEFLQIFKSRPLKVNDPDHHGLTQPISTLMVSGSLCRQAIISHDAHYADK